MADNRHRRIVRRAVIAMAVLALLMSGYVSSFVAVHLTAGSHFWNVAVNSWFYRPLKSYKFSYIVGHVEFRALCTWVQNNCRGSLGEFCESERMREREGGDLFEQRGKRNAEQPAGRIPQGSTFN
jgi:hypothetical protein